MRLEDLKDDTCGWCGGEIDMSRPHASKRLFCCRACSTAAYHQLDKHARLEAKQGRVCAECGGPIPPAKRGKVTKYCSLMCQRIASESVRTGRYPLVCQVCETPFFGHYARQLYCGNACKARVGVMVRRARAKPPVSVACRWCGETFLRRFNHVSRVLCSRPCADLERAARAAARRIYREAIA